MSVTFHNNFLEMPTGAVDWPAIYNALLAQLELGRTIRINAGEAIAQYKAVYIHTDGKAYKADSGKVCLGVSVSADTAINVDLYVQIDGTVTNGAWSWSPGNIIYMTTAGALTTSVSGDPIGIALSATEILLRLQH
jgi:hypothetical protein